MKRKPKRKAKPKPKIAKPVALICHEVRRLREELGLTQEQLAERVNLTPNYIGAIELGKRDPSISSMRALAEGLGVSLSELLGAPAELSEAAQKMADSFDEAPEELQRALLGVLHASIPKQRRP